MFDQTLAEKHLKQLLKHYKIHVYAWSKSSCGVAYYTSKRIKIPHPTNTDRFGVCMHEIKHVIDGKGKFSFEDEFNADKFALEQIRLLGFEGEDNWIKRMKWHNLSRIAMAHNRRLDHKNINSEIREFFSDVDFTLWKKNKIFVRLDKKDPRGYKIQITKTFTKEELGRFLDNQDLVLEKSDTHQAWVVRDRSNIYREEFSNLSEIGDKFQYR